MAEIESANQSDATGILAERMLKHSRAKLRWQYIKWGGLGLLFVSTVTGLVVMQSKGEAMEAKASEPHLAVVSLRGAVGVAESAKADTVIPILRRAFKADQSKGVLFVIDSPGGAPVDAERINSEVARLRVETKKPIYAVIEGTGASAAYMVAMRTDKVYVAKYSMVGSIGAVVTTWDVSTMADKIGVRQNVFASGPLKAMGNMWQTMDDKSRDKAQAIVNNMGSMFAAEVAEARKSRLKQFDYATGEVWHGPQAVAYGLADAIGTRESVAAELKLKTRSYDPSAAQSLFGMSATSKLAEDLTRGALAAFEPQQH